MNYSKKVKELREVMILSQNELAQKLGVSFASVNRWEKGKHEPTIKTKRALKKLFLKNKINQED